MDRRKFLVTAGASLAASTLNPASGEMAAPAAKHDATMHTSKPDRPNIIVIICDDLGYGDLGCYGSKLATPNIDRLAAQGVRFNHHCTPIALCSASRAALMTGLYPTRVGATGAFGPLSDTGMSLDAVTMANLLHNAGYTSLAVGKWHLGDLPQYSPTQRGFDEFFGVPYSVDMDPLPLLHNSTILEKEGDRDTLTQQYTKKAVEFLSQPKEKPFFLYMAHSYPHIPLHASTSFRGKSNLGLYGDVVEEIDWSVGEILRTLEANGAERKNPGVFYQRSWPLVPGKHRQSARAQGRRV